MTHCILHADVLLQDELFSLTHWNLGQLTDIPFKQIQIHVADIKYCILLWISMMFVPIGWSYHGTNTLHEVCNFIQWGGWNMMPQVTYRCGQEYPNNRSHQFQLVWQNALNITGVIVNNSWLVLNTRSYLCCMTTFCMKYGFRTTNYRVSDVLFTFHYGDVIMGTIASQITSLTVVYSTVYSGADQRKHQSSASLAFLRGIHRGPVNCPHKWPVTRKLFPFDDVIMWFRL